MNCKKIAIAVLTAIAIFTVMAPWLICLEEEGRPAKENANRIR